MRIDFRIDWGYQYLYSRRHYHPVYIWDGSLSCKNGEIIEIYQLDYPVIWFGPGHCAKETRLEKPEWKNRTKRGVSGIHVIAEVDEADCIFVLETSSGTFRFDAKELLKNGKLDFPVGPKYLGCFVTVTTTGYLWFRPLPKEREFIFEADQLGLEIHDWARMRLGWLNAGASVTFEATVPEMKADYSETLIHIVAMGCPAYNAEKEIQVNARIPFELYCDGEKIKEFSRYYRQHDNYMQILEDEWIRVQVKPGKHIFELKNMHDEVCLGISRIIISQCCFMHGQLSVPEWCLKGERITGKVFAAREEDISVLLQNNNSDSTHIADYNEEYKIECVQGWNEFILEPTVSGTIKICTEADCKEIDVFDCEEEKYPVKVGYDMTVVPHDNNGFMDWLLDYTQRTRLGNYVVFRSFTRNVDPKLMKRWGSFCKEHGIYVSACEEFLEGSLIDASGEWFNDCGMHEYPGCVYAKDPETPYASVNMKEASEKYIAYLKEKIDLIHTVSNCAAFGDASGGSRYSFRAGADFVRAETMVGHTMTLLSQVRPAAEALGKGRWGVHIAIQHGYQPYKETHLGQYFLSLMQPWMMGAEAIYEEDSLFCLFKEERQTWDDCLTKGKRDMTRNFYKFVKTHPRKGKCVRNIAFIEGRYAAPFNGFICGSEQDPHYSVWGLFGNDNYTWGHGQPEKCRQLLDVLMPGASTQPLRQKFDKRRFFFSGTPYGDFDCMPVEADADYYKNYKLMLHLGWNTMIDEDYSKLKGFVEDGGVLITGLTQFSTHISRDFLENMDDLLLWNHGDLEELCGICVNGRGDTYSGQWNCSLRDKMPEPELSAEPSDNIDEDGMASLADVELCGAQVIAWDAATGKPMLVRKQVGKGMVYTFTLWAYPGHEKFMSFVAAWIAELAKQSLSDVYVEDPSGEVFWTCWKDGNKDIIMLLNTDWTVYGNIKSVKVVVGNFTYTVSVTERIAVIVEVYNGEISIKEYSL